MEFRKVDAMNEINSDLEFEAHIKKLNDRGLIEFVARQQYDMAKICPIHDKRLKAVEGKSKKALASSGGIGVIIGGIIIAIVEYFSKK